MNECLHPKYCFQHHQTFFISYDIQVILTKVINWRQSMAFWYRYYELLKQAAHKFNALQANIYLFKVNNRNIETLEKGAKYVQI